MTRFAKGLKAALESEGSELPVDPALDVVADPAADAAEQELEVICADDNVIVDNSDSAEEAEGEADAAEAVVEEEEAKADEIEEAAAGLEAIYDSLKAAAKSKPLTKETVQFANIAIESYGNRIGMAEHMTLSTEGRGNTVSLEGIKETLKKAWDWMVAQIKRIWAAVTAFFKRLFSMAERVKQRGEKLARWKAAGPAANKTFDVGALAKALTLNGKVVTDAKAGLVDIDKAVRGYASRSSQVSEKMVATANDLGAFASGKLDSAKLESTAKSLQAAHERALEGNSAEDTLIGGVAIKSDVREFFGQKFHYTRLVAVDVKVPEKTEIDVLAQGQIREIGAIAAKTAGSIVAARASMEADAKKVTAALKDLKVSKELNPEERKAFNTATSLLRFHNSVMATGNLKINSHALKTALAYVKLAEKSAAQYKAEKKAA